MEQITKREIKFLSLKEMSPEGMMKQFIEWAKAFVDVHNEDTRVWVETNIISTTGGLIKFFALQAALHTGYIIVDYEAKTVIAVCTPIGDSKIWTVQRAQLFWNNFQ